MYECSILFRQQGLEDEVCLLRPPEERAVQNDLIPVPAVATGHSYVILYPAYNNV